MTEIHLYQNHFKFLSDVHIINVLHDYFLFLPLYLSGDDCKTYGTKGAGGDFFLVFVIFFQNATVSHGHKIARNSIP